MYKDIIHKLHQTILKADAKSTVPLLKKNPRISKEKQLAVYIDGYRIRLSDAVRSDHKALCHYYRKKADRLINKFVEDVNSDSYSLDFYPFKFATYIQNKKLPKKVKELILLESAIGQIFMAKDSEPLHAETLTSMNELQIESFRFKPRTASALLAFEYDVERYLQEFRAEKNPKKINKKNIYLYIVRNNNEIFRHYLLAEEYEVLSKLISGSSTEDAVTNEMITEMFPQWLHKWLINGFFAE